RGDADAEERIAANGQHGDRGGVPGRGRRNLHGARVDARGQGDGRRRVGGTCHRTRRPRVEVAMMFTPDGHSRLELSRFVDPPIAADHRTDPVNSLGYLRAMFAVSDIDETLERLQGRGATLVGDVVQYESAYRLCYVRGQIGR